MSKPTPQQRAESLVRVGPKQQGQPWFIELREMLPESIFIGPYQNPAVAEKEAKRIRQYLAALIRDVRHEKQP
jgi:hypothetical protein